MIAIGIFTSFLLFSSSISAENWKRYLKFDSNYELWWSMYDDSITFQVEVATNGWVGFGISSNGGMKGSDIVIGWINDNQAMFHDRHAEGKFQPKIDEQQDWELLWHEKNDTHTKLRFKRLLDTCDDQDIVITEETMRLIYAYSHQNPNSIDAVSYHGPTTRGTKSVFLKEEVEHKFTEKPEDIYHWDVRSPNVTIPEGSDTEYFCTFIRVPHLDRKNHIIEFGPLIQPGHEGVVHHMLLYECTGVTNETVLKYADKSYHRCYTKNLVPKFPFCLTANLAWAFGGSKFYFPENAGHPLGLPDAEWFLLEVHYDNPSLKTAVDNSGLRITYTPKLRKYDSSVLATGNLWYPCMFVPPKQKEFVISGHVAPSCLKQRVPPGGIKVFSILLHSHFLGRRIIVRHFRGNEELEPIASDVNYDFNLQHFRKLSKIRTVLPDDHLIVECAYDSRKRSRVTFGGLSSREEMCIVFLMYYPRISLALTASCPLPKNFLSSLGVKRIFEDDKFLISPFTGKNESFFEFLYDYPWNKNAIDVSRKSMRYSPQLNLCTDRGWKLVPTFILSTYPKVKKSYVKPSKCGFRRNNQKRLDKENENTESENEFEDINFMKRSSSNGSVIPYPLLDQFFSTLFLK
ncbi:DBH-like monooxygenase protein 1 [Centruroides sculpturatus]|uniref:DBH-like monooxygenase protein 1 n=1 Tax=Centruroides sculpturatus TaxID=218467 RepID=UPI000C6D87D5|nr:DBH-like monooxygenase protein 1 [Centruroides sculpturatus]